MEAGKIMSINLRLADAQKEYEAALREKYISGLELNKNEAIIKFILDNEDKAEREKNG